MTQKVYAFVENDTIKDYPILEQHIINRGQSLSWYTEVIFRPKPVVPDFHCLVETLTLENSKVYANYTVREYSLDEVLSLYVFRQADQARLEGGPQVVVTVADVQPLVLQQVTKLITAKCQELLDNFVKTRDYDNLVTCLLYAATSKVPRFVADGVRAGELRDAMWVSVYNYQTKVMTGQIGLPRSFDEIIPHLPVLSWQAD